MMNRLWLISLALLVAAPALAQKKKDKSKDEEDLYLYTPPALSYLTVGGFYPNSVRAVAQGKNPYFSVTWKSFDAWSRCACIPFGKS